MTHVAKLVLIVAVAGCAGLVEPPIPVDDYELPPPDLSLDPARLRPGVIIWSGCSLDSGVEQFRGVYEWLLVDIHSGGGDGSGMSNDDVERIKAIGARVLYQFNAPAVRARVLQADIPDLRLSLGQFVFVRDVPDDTRYDVRGVSPGFRTYSLDRQEALYSGLGGLVTYRSERFDWISGVLPDRSIAALGQHPDVESVSVSGMGCLAF